MFGQGVIVRHVDCELYLYRLQVFGQGVIVRHVDCELYLFGL